MNFISLGTVQTLTIDRKIDTGYVLVKDNQDILLHEKETIGSPAVGDKIEVFLYNDKNNRTVATMTIPSVQLGTYDWAEVVEVIPNLGVFVNIHINKEMLVSIDDLPLFQSVWPEVGDKLFVTLGKDRQGRLLALPAGEKVIWDRREIAPDELLNQQVSGYVYLTSREGSAFFSEAGYRGFIHHSERTREPRLGEFITGRVIEVKDDASINVSLLPLKQDRISDDAAVILEHLEANGGVIPFSDKSDPADIQGTFGFSKSAFKRALGNLLKQQKIEQKNGKTYIKK